MGRPAHTAADRREQRAMGARLRALRRGRRPDLTLAKFAAMLEISTQEVRNWEQGKAAIPDRQKRAIGRVLDCLPTDLYPPP
jgi:DNA-binding transcriptional regulator YiaG